MTDCRDVLICHIELFLLFLEALKNMDYNFSTAIALRRSALHCVVANWCQFIRKTQYWLQMQPGPTTNICPGKQNRFEVAVSANNLQSCF